MKYAILDGKLTHISKVKKGTIARVFGYSDDLVIAVEIGRASCRERV